LKGLHRADHPTSRVSSPGLEALILRAMEEMAMKAKCKKTSRPGKKNHLKTLIDAFIKAANPSKKGLITADPAKSKKPGVVKNLTAIVCDAETEDLLKRLSNKLGASMNDIIRGSVDRMEAGPFHSALGKLSAKIRIEKFDWYDYQYMANEIWGKYPLLSKLEVAKRIRFRLESFKTDDKIPAVGSIRQKITHP